MTGPMPQRAIVVPGPEDIQRQPARRPDGLQPQATPQAPDEPQNLLTIAPELVAQQVVKLGDDLAKLPEVSKREAQWAVNRYRREGYCNVRLKKRDNQQAYYAWFPLGGAQKNLEYYNHARVLCRTFVAQIYADPPAPIVEPTDAGEDDRDAAEVATRALLDLQSELRLNTPEKCRRAKDRGCTYGSGFVHYWVDEYGRREPVRITASPHPEATAQDPLVNPQTGMPHGSVQMVDGPTGPVPQPAEPPAPVERFVAQDGQALADDPAQAQLQWAPDLRSEVLDGRFVRMIPHTATVKDAHGVVIDVPMTWGQAKRCYPTLAGVSSDVKQKMLSYSPPHAESILGRDRPKGPKDGDEATVWCRKVVYRECPDYEDGAYVVVVGGTEVVYRDKLAVYRDGKRYSLPLPIAQDRGWDNGEGDVNPYGGALMDDLGGPAELMAAMTGFMVAYNDRWSNMPVFLPTTSDITSSDLLKPVVRYTPTGQNAKPEAVRGPGLDQSVPALYEHAKNHANAASHLMETAQGVEDPGVRSGRHAFQIVAQAQAQLSEPRQNSVDCYLQCCRIEMAYARAYNIGGEAKWTGNDGKYKVERWEAADLEGDVRLKPGTMTMQSPAAKMDFVMQLATGPAPLLPPDQAMEFLTDGLGFLLGKWDNPFTLEIRRSIAQWEQGAPAGWMPPRPVMQVVPGPMGPVQQMVAPPDPVVSLMFPDAPHHQLPGVAQIRVTELAKAMAGTKWQAMLQTNGAWAQVLIQEFEKAKLAAAPPMPMPAPGGAPGQPPPSGQQDFAQGNQPPLDNPQAKAA